MRKGKCLLLLFSFFSALVHLYGQQPVRDTSVTAIDSAYSFSDRHCTSVYFFSTKGKWGTLDEKKQIVRPAIYDTLLFRILPSCRGTFVGFIAKKDGKYAFLGENEKLQENFVYDTIYPPYTNGAWYHFIASKNGKYGIVNYDGKVVVPFIYDYESSFDDGGWRPSRIMVNEKSVFYVNENTSIHFCFLVNDSLEAWGVDKRWGVVLKRSENKSLVLTRGTWSNDGNYFTVCNETDTSYHYLDGNWLSLPIWIKSIRLDGNGKNYIVQTRSGRFGIADRKLRLICDTVYRNYCESMEELPDGTTFRYMQKAAPGKTMYDFEGDWIMTDAKGKPVNKLVLYKPYAFVRYLWFYNDTMYLCDGSGKWGRIDSRLRWIEPPRFDTMWCLQWDTLNTRAAFVVKENGRYGVLDSGRMVVPCIYTQAIYRLGGYYVILRNEEDTVIYIPMKRSLAGFDTMAVRNSLFNYGTWYMKPPAIREKLKRTNSLMTKSIYGQRFHHGEIFSPYLYSPETVSGDHHITNSYPFYQPARPYIPWFHLLSAYADTAFFSYAYYYDAAETYSYHKLMDPREGSWNILRYRFPAQDSITYVNCLLTGDSCVPLTFDMIFREDTAYAQELEKLFLLHARKNRQNLPAGDLELYDGFYITANGIAIFFRSSEKDFAGNTQIFGMLATWKMLAPLLDENGPVKAPTQPQR